MSALYGPNSASLPHVNVFRWAQTKNVLIPIDFKKTPGQEALILNYLANRVNFVKLPQILEEARFSEALKEAIQYLPSRGFKDKTVVAFQIAGTIFFAVLYVMNNATSKL